MHSVQTTGTKDLEALLSKYQNVFDKILGQICGTYPKLSLDLEAKSKYSKLCPVPCILRTKIEQELKRLQKEGRISPVEFSELATTIVPIHKSNKAVQICEDYKVTINSVTKLDSYTIPKISMQL